MPFKRHLVLNLKVLLTDDIIFLPISNIIEPYFSNIYHVWGDFSLFWSFFSNYFKLIALVCHGIVLDKCVQFGKVQGWNFLRSVTVDLGACRR